MNACTLFHFRRTRGAMADACRLLWAGGLIVSAVGVPAATASGHAAATQPGVASLSQLRFPEGSSHMLLADRLWLYGQPARVLVFDVPAKASDLIRTLSGQQPRLADLNVLPGQLVLSGQVGDEQWVAQMEDTGTGRTVGSISTLRWQSPMAQSAPAWLPDGARLRLDFAVMDEGVTVSERIWQHALPPARMMALLDVGLQREGWRQSGGRDAQSWVRGRQRLQVSVVSLDGGSGLRVRGWTS